MAIELTLEDIGVLLESLSYAKLNVESKTYTTYEMKQEQLQRVENLAVKLRAIRDSLATN